MISDEREKKKRVVVTGVGAVCPVGNNIEEMWKSLIEGKSGVGYITTFDTTPFDTKIAAEVKNFDVCLYVTRKQAQRMDRFTQFTVGASLQAAQMSRLTINDSNALDSGVIVGNCVGGLLSVCEELKILAEQGPRKIRTILAPIMIPDAPAIQVSLLLGTKGINYAPSSACSSSSDAIGHGYEAIKHGNARVMIVGGTDAPILPIAIAAFGNIRALSTNNDNPAAACRPFDAKRDGFVMGEGAGMMVLEEAAYAEKRGAPIIAELVGYANTTDAFHLTAPAPDGVSAARAVQLALERANVSPDEVDYINAHGTATLLHDRTETNVIKNVFGEKAEKIPISATKSMTGHLLGAAGGIEAVITVLTMLHGVIPPTINLTNPDPDCDLDYVPNTARQAEIKTAISNSFGFGGHNSVLVFKNYS